MTEEERYEERKTAIHMLRSGIPPEKVAKELKRSVSWVYKWRGRYQQHGWAGLRSQSRAPKHIWNRLSEAIRQSIRQTRSELEAQAEEGNGELRYIGAEAVQARMREKGIEFLPSPASIERVLREAGMTGPRQAEVEEDVNYPRLHPTELGQLCQVDIVPHFLTGGESVACFNAIDVVSRYPTGQAYERRRSQDAIDFLVHVWQEIGIPQYTQVDNEGCFSGGFTHPGVLGKVVRLALYVGTELVFSPVRHPQSNGYVERFHQDYDLHVWQDTHLLDRDDVQVHADVFFANYRHSRHHSALKGYSPIQVHTRSALPKLSADFALPQTKLLLTQGRIHFMRRVDSDKTVSVLNLSWAVPQAEPQQGVWVTIHFQPSQATLRVYDQAPDVLERRCLAEHPFPLKEPVQSFQLGLLPRPTTSLLADLFTSAFNHVRVLFSTMF